ncbi:restriction endonuclease fold toxin [Nocardia sp. NPDC058058]|uniref:restriction endonuclease fold toxin n=1 Tax=Nocardia sp. NPDC058058 TaxID=3346317 RepID=UPI0036DE9FA8
MNVDFGAYYAVGRACFGLNDALQSAFLAETRAMADCGAMAGVDETGAAWGQKYDLRAAEVLTMVSDLGEGLQKLGNVIVQAGYNHYLADYDSILDSTVPPAAKPAGPIPACLYYGSAPSAGGPSDGLREAADSLIRLADKVGIDIPDGNTDKLQTAADAWNRLHTGHTELSSVLKNAASVMDRNDVEDASEFTRRLLDLQSAMDDILAACGELAHLCTTCKSDLDHLRGVILHRILVELSWAVAGELTIAIASAWFTFGITAVTMTGVTAATVTRYALRITESVSTWRTGIAAARARFALRDLGRSRKTIDEAKQLETVADDAVTTPPKSAGAQANSGRYSGGLVKVNKLDPDADKLAERIGGESRVRFDGDTAGREFDAVSDDYIAQAKPANFQVNKKFRTQARATFEAAQDTGRSVYYHFDGPPQAGVREKLQQYADEYGVELVIDVMPF